MVMQQFAKLCNRKVELVRFQYAPPMSVRENGNPQVSKTLRTQFDSEDRRQF